MKLLELIGEALGLTGSTRPCPQRFSETSDTTFPAPARVPQGLVMHEFREEIEAYVELCAWQDQDRVGRSFQIEHIAGAYVVHLHDGSDICACTVEPSRPKAIRQAIFEARDSKKIRIVLDISKT